MAERAIATAVAQFPNRGRFPFRPTHLYQKGLRRNPRFQE
jgi:hypothetical protein